MTSVVGAVRLQSIEAPSRRWWAMAALILSAVALLGTAVLVAVGSGSADADQAGEWVVACFAPGFLVSGWWLVRRRPALSLGWLFLAAGSSVALAGLAAAWTLAARAESWPGADWSLWVFSWLWQPHSVLLGVALVLFPDGVTRGRWHRSLVGVMLVSLGASMALSVVQPGAIVTTPDHLDGSLTGLVNPVGIGALRGSVDALQGVLLGLGALAVALRLPYAAVVATDGRELASTGAPEGGDLPAERPLVHRGATVGLLRVGHRRGSDELVPAEVELLDNLARQIGATVVAGELLEGLRAAQERLVLARHDERRRIQRDLHDGLGPELTAVMLKLDAARNHLAGGDVEQVDDLVGSARRGMGTALGDVRRLVYSLGDPTLASLGLGAATRDHVRSLTQGTGLVVTVEADDLPDLPAATEEAAYRIVGEAVTNVARHAGATCCRVELSCDDAALVVLVIDDGCGIDPTAAPGVGRRSMADRASELGGEFELAPGPSGGTIVRLRLPLGATHDRVA